MRFIRTQESLKKNHAIVVKKRFRCIANIACIRIKIHLVISLLGLFLTRQCTDNETHEYKENNVIQCFGFLSAVLKIFSLLT